MGEQGIGHAEHDAAFPASDHRRHGECLNRRGPLVQEGSPIGAGVVAAGIQITLDGVLNEAGLRHVNGQSGGAAALRPWKEYRQIP